METKEIVWNAPEFQYRYKDASWYLLSVAITVILVLLAIWQKNILFAIFVIIAELTIIHWAKRVPKILEFKISNRGVGIGKIKFYPYEELIGFHIRDNQDGAEELILATKSKINPFIKISIPNQDIPEMKELLKKFLNEVEYEESVIDVFIRMIGF